MAYQEFTPRWLQAIKPHPKRRLEFWDSVVPGLVLRVTPRAVKTFAVRYRVNGDPRRYTIGKAESVTLADARQRAREVLADAGNGADAAQAKKEARAEAQRRELVGDNFESLARRCLETIGRDLKPRSLAEYKRALEYDVFPELGMVRPESIERGHVRALLAKVVERAPVQANRTFAAIRRVFSWAVEQDLLVTSPCLGIKAPSRERERDRVYSSEEIRAIVKGTAATRLRHLVLLAFYTAARSEELRSARWSDMDFEARLWTIPAARSKSGKANPIPLSPGAMRVLKALPRTSDYVFPAGDGFTQHDQNAVEAVRETSGVADFRLHDVRRTAATRMAAKGVLPDVVELILGHSLPKLQRTYQTHSYEAEKRSALAAWSRDLDQILRVRIA